MGHLLSSVRREQGPHTQRWRHGSRKQSLGSKRQTTQHEPECVTPSLASLSSVRVSSSFGLDGGDRGGGDSVLSTPDRAASLVLMAPPCRAASLSSIA